MAMALRTVHLSLAASYRVSRLRALHSRSRSSYPQSSGRGACVMVCFISRSSLRYRVWRMQAFRCCYRRRICGIQMFANSASSPCFSSSCDRTTHRASLSEVALLRIRLSCTRHLLTMSCARLQTRAAATSALPLPNSGKGKLSDATDGMIATAAEICYYLEQVWYNELSLIGTCSRNTPLTSSSTLSPECMVNVCIM